MGRMLAKLYENGWKTSRSDKDPICWRPRESNTAADHLCNYTMDAGSSWSTADDNALASLTGKKFNLHLHSDGGMRRGIAAAGGFTLTALIWDSDDCEWSRLLLAR